MGDFYEFYNILQLHEQVDALIYFQVRQEYGLFHFLCIYHQMGLFDLLQVLHKLKSQFYLKLNHLF